MHCLIIRNLRNSFSSESKNRHCKCEHNLPRVFTGNRYRVPTNTPVLFLSYKEISITIVRPQSNSNETLPVVMYFHGGGWVLGGFDTHERLVRELANKANVVIIFVNYTPSPEAKYPVALEESYAATIWIAQNGKTVNVTASRLAVAGDSVGGNRPAAVALLAKERGGPQIRYQLLFYPVTDANFETLSYMKYQEGYWLSREASGSGIIMFQIRQI